MPIPQPPSCVPGSGMPTDVTPTSIQRAGNTLDQLRVGAIGTDPGQTLFKNIDPHQLTYLANPTTWCLHKVAGLVGHDKGTCVLQYADLLPSLLSNDECAACNVVSVAGLLRNIGARNSAINLSVFSCGGDCRNSFNASYCPK